MKSKAPLVICLVLIAVLMPLRLVLGFRSPGPVGFGFGAMLLAVGSLPLVLRALRRTRGSRERGSASPPTGVYRGGAGPKGEERRWGRGHELVGEIVCIVMAVAAFAMLRALVPTEKPGVECVAAPCGGAGP